MALAVAQGFQAEFIAWICFFVGLLLLLVGMALGLQIVGGPVGRDLGKIVQEIESKLAEVQGSIELLANQASERIAADAKTGADAETAQATTTATKTAAKTKGEEIAALIASLPIKLRFQAC